MNEIEAYVLKLFHDQDSPLDKMYDSWFGGDDWREGAPMTRHKIWDEAGMPVACHLCGEVDQWVAGGHEKNLAFICVHEPVWIGRGSIPQVSSMPVRKVSRYEIVD